MLTATIGRHQFEGQTSYALDRDSRKAAPARFLMRALGADSVEGEAERRLAALALVQIFT
ncbi:hypothetical protein FDV58_33345 [Bradyrhizobium elkanii]|uniref:Uncharacterized protein n=1 Tax=Bradyrhizobium elkanii TaxID=29448 RepID=A0A4U6RJ81_BRAEL|nr:hypothetical protein [Bradyrhizobium sp. BR2003]TKV74110.1 hypothetical protein FDV58_33345 [Bradyrhizobium elkanii]